MKSFRRYNIHNILIVVVDHIGFRGQEGPKLKKQESFQLICHAIIDLILGDLSQSVFSVVSAPDNIVQSELVSITNTAGF